MGLLVRFFNLGEPRPHLRGTGLLPLQRRHSPAYVEAGDEGHALAGIAAMVHALHLPGLSQRLVDQPRPRLADEFQGVDGTLAALDRDAIQGRDLLSQGAIWLHFARAQ